MIFPLFLGPPKGVSLTHYNMVANITQLAHPDILMLDIDPNNQEITVAVLPFFHIYAMTTVMSMGLHYGLKLVTLPKFEPETYLKACVQYKVKLATLRLKFSGQPIDFYFLVELLAFQICVYFSPPSLPWFRRW